MPADDPGYGELVREIRKLRADVAALPKDIAATYVRRDVYEAEQRATAAEQRTMQAEIKELKERASFALRGFALPILTAIIIAILLARGAAG